MLLNARKIENLPCEISGYDPDFVKKIEVARRGMNKYRKH